MNAWRLLRSLESLEDSMAHYYDLMRLRNTQDPAVAAFFTQMRDEEISHRDLVRLEQRMMLRSPQGAVEIREYDQAALEGTLGTVEDLIARCGSLTLEQALQSSLQIERAATQQHYRTVAGMADAELGRLVTTLGGCDRDHTERLEGFARAHGIGLPG